MAVLAVATAAATVLTGCFNPDGVDGDLTDDWASFGKPALFVPAADTCHGSFREVGYLSSYQPVDCTRTHLVEALHVGTFTGEHANRETPPPAGSPGVRAAHGQCAKKVTEVLGADWRTGRLKMAVVLPSDAGWTGGARWFRCDVGEIRSLDDPDFIIRSGSLKGALKGTSKLAYGCFKPELSDGHVETMAPVACTTRHRAEFVGIYPAPDTTYERFKSNNERTHRECRTRVASYVKVPNDSNLKYRTGTITYYPSEEEWEAGDRGVQCFLWFSDRDLTRSLKGTGTKGLPIN
jgi:hypothetical protein